MSLGRETLNDSLVILTSRSSRAVASMRILGWDCLKQTRERASWAAISQMLEVVRLLVKKEERGGWCGLHPAIWFGPASEKPNVFSPPSPHLCTAYSRHFILSDTHFPTFSVRKRKPVARCRIVLIVRTFFTPSFVSEYRYNRIQ